MARGKRTNTRNSERSNPRKKVKVDYTLNEDIANWLRIDSIRSVNVTKSGHPTSCSSIADIFSILFFHEEGLKFHANNPSHFLNDRLVLSKGHAAPILYASLFRAGVITEEQLLSLRKKDSIIEGHPVPKIPFVDVATGSLGQGLSVAAGMAYSSKYFDKIDNRVFCVCGDGQVAEGSVWQAANFASHYKLNNLVAIIDVNRLGQSQATLLGHDIDTYQKRFSAFGWQVIPIDGHSMEQIVEAFVTAKKSEDQPIAIIAKTFKGKGFGEEIEDKLDWHGKDLGKSSQTVINHLKQNIKTDPIEFKTYQPEGDQPAHELGLVSIKPNYEHGTKISTRKAYGNGLTHARDSNHNVIGLDGDTKNSTFSITLKNKYPQSFIQCFIAQQNLVGVTTGLSCRSKIPFCSTFSAFFSRAADQIRIAGISNSNIKLVGSHSGVSIGEDGPSQMALEDIAFFRTIPKGIVLVPSDGYSAQKAVQLAANFKGPAFIRTSRPDVSLLYNADTVFQLGKIQTIKKSQNDQVLFASYGVTTHESIKAAQELEKQGIKVRVIDLFSLKPLDHDGIKSAIQNSKGNVIVVEEHYPQGGAGEAICNTAFSAIKKFQHLCVRKVPSSATPTQQLEIHGLDSKSIIHKAKQLLGKL